MRISLLPLVVLAFSGVLGAHASAGQKQRARSPRILAAKTVYFDNRIGSDAVGNRALARLKRWGKFQIVPDQKQADLIFVLSADPSRGGHIITSGGQTGSIDSSGHLEEDPVPNYNGLSRTRYAYLTVFDRATGEKLWSWEHVWGGLLTGFNSVGDRLIRELEKQSKK